MVRFALFKDGVQISKAHTHRSVAVMEAVERGIVCEGEDETTCTPVTFWADGYDVREVADD